MIQKRKNIKTLGNLINTRGGATPPGTNLIASCVDALSITYCIFQLLVVTAGQEKSVLSVLNLIAGKWETSTIYQCAVQIV
jgi:hypothetical protein